MKHREPKNTFLYYIYISSISRGILFVHCNISNCSLERLLPVGLPLIGRAAAVGVL